VFEVLARTAQTFVHSPKLRFIKVPKMVTSVFEESIFVDLVTEYGPIARGKGKWFG
jgi:hypothetical protein